MLPAKSSKQTKLWFGTCQIVQKYGLTPLTNCAKVRFDPSDPSDSEVLDDIPSAGRRRMRLHAATRERIFRDVIDEYCQYVQCMLERTRHSFNAAGPLVDTFDL
jgi:predicted acetyltransferase